MPRPVSSLMFFERGTQSSTRHRRLQASPALRSSRRACAAGGAGVRQSVRAARGGRRERPPAADRARQLVQHACRDAICRCEAAGACDSWPQSRHSQKAQIMALGGQLQMLTQPISDAARNCAPRSRAFSPATAMRTSASWAAAFAPWRNRAHADRCAPLQRHAAHRHAGELRRHGAARECDAGLHPVANGHSRRPTGRLRASSARPSLSDPKDPHRRGFAPWWPGLARRRRPRPCRWW